MSIKLDTLRSLPLNSVDFNTIGTPLPLTAGSSSSRTGEARKRRRLGKSYIPAESSLLEHSARVREHKDGSGGGSNPRKRKLSEAQHVAACARERWAAYEKLTATTGRQQESGKENVAPARRSPSPGVGSRDDENPALCYTTQVIATSGSFGYSQQDSATQYGDDSMNISVPLQIRSQGSMSTDATPTSLVVPRPIPRLKPSACRTTPSELEPYEMEAMRMVINHAQAGKGRFPCMRPGCHDILNNVAGLARHLHMHDIRPDPPRSAHPNGFICSSCRSAYESSRELLMHNCLRHQNQHSSDLASDSRRYLKGRFMNVLRFPKLACLNILSSRKRSRRD